MLPWWRKQIIIWTWRDTFEPPQNDFWFYCQHIDLMGSTNTATNAYCQDAVSVFFFLHIMHSGEKYILIL